MLRLWFAAVLCADVMSAWNSIFGSTGDNEAIGDASEGADKWDGWFPIKMNYIPYRTNPSIKMCRLKHNLHYSEPNKYPMFRDLVAASNCHKTGNQKQIRLKELESFLDAEEKNKATTPSIVLKPQGFAFHESRCGSTLVANMLTKYDPLNLVYSEVGSSLIMAHFKSDSILLFAQIIRASRRQKS